ncbi:helix-turn-helix domain-containing protein [Aeromonas veronii]|uniref:helix-turn-helix domain-containing protein n=1 Tax=Aeromonas veronii TaxID=654 RepID=UPI003007E3B0
MLEDVFNSIKAHLYDRAVSPLMGSFIVSWIVWNYKLPLLIMSKEPILEKYRIISEVLYTSESSIYLNGLAYPTLTALAYIFIYPYPAEFVFKFTRNRQKSISNIKRRIESETLLTIKESVELRREIERLEDVFIADLGKKDAEIERLKVKLNESTPAKIDTENEGGSIINNMLLNETEYEILSILEDENISESTIVRLFDGRRTTGWVKYHLEKLERLGLINKTRDEFGDEVWYITYNGRTYLIEKQLAFEKNEL